MHCPTPLSAVCHAFSFTSLHTLSQCHAYTHVSQPLSSPLFAFSIPESYLHSLPHKLLRTVSLSVCQDIRISSLSCPPGFSSLSACKLFTSVHAHSFSLAITVNPLTVLHTLHQHIIAHHSTPPCSSTLLSCIESFSSLLFLESPAYLGLGLG